MASGLKAVVDFEMSLSIKFPQSIWLNNSINSFFSSVLIFLFQPSLLNPRSAFPKSIFPCKPKTQGNLLMWSIMIFVLLWGILSKPMEFKNSSRLFFCLSFSCASFLF
jgi:hypothetical protein